MAALDLEQGLIDLHGHLTFVNVRLKEVSTTLQLLLQDLCRVSYVPQADLETTCGRSPDTYESQNRPMAHSSP